MLKNKLNFNLSIFFNIVIFKDKKINLLVFNNNFIINLLKIENLKIFFFNKGNNNIIYYTKYSIIKNITNSKLKKYFLLKNIFYFVKIKFKGKGYKIQIFKKKKLINFFFNHSHITIIKIKKIKIKEISKNKFLLLNKNWNDLKKILFKVIYIRRINVYTLRGLRGSKQIIFKRKGKKGSYI